MPELWLNFADENGQKRRVAVSTDRFVIGRQPGNDLTIADSRLSRRHAYIRKAGDRFEIADEGSSNGTDINGEPVFDPITIKNGDVLSFGGVEVRVEIVSAAAATTVVPPPVPVPAPSKAPGKVEKDSAEPEEGRSVGLGLILLAPILALVLIVLAGGVVYLLVSQGSRDVTANELDTDDPVIDEDDVPKNTEPDDDDTKPTPKTADSPSNSGPGTDGPTPTPANLSETAKVEVNGASFLRKIAQNDPKAFLTSEQAKRVGAKVKQLSVSSGVTENINSARKNAAQIKTLAASKNMKPEFLAAAAIAKLGTNRGDVMASAQSMADVLDKLSTQLGTELADDCLLTVAAFDQGAAGETMKMRNMLQDLANKTNESSRAIRTIWFLQKQGKISAAEFERALTFLAIGTITQNPKDFAVNTEALSF